jgi:hypothetical protein
MTKDRRKSSLVRAQFLAVIAEAKRQAIDLEMQTPTETDVIDDEHRGISDVVIARGGRKWYIAVDTCFGHSNARLQIVPGVERILDEPAFEPDLEPEAEPTENDRLKALFLTTAQKVRLMAMSSIFLSAAKTTATTAKAQESMMKLLEEDSENDPALNIPMFGPIEHGPPPLVEIDDEEALEQQRTRKQKRSSVFVAAIESSITQTGRVIGIDPKALANVRQQFNDITESANDGTNNDDNDDDDDADLLEGFGNRPERRSVQVRKFVRRNKFLKKVFGSKKTSTATDHLDIAHDNY